MSAAASAPPSERSMRIVLWTLRWLTILAAAGAGFGFLVWKRAPRPLELQVEFVLPGHGRYELFVNGRSLGHRSVVLDGAMLEDLDDRALSSLAWPPPDLERIVTADEQDGASVTTGFVDLGSGTWALHMRLREGRWNVRRGLTFQVLDAWGKAVKAWSNRETSFDDHPMGRVDFHRQRITYL